MNEYSLAKVQIKISHCIATLCTFRSKGRFFVYSNSLNNVKS